MPKDGGNMRNSVAGVGDLDGDGEAGVAEAGFSSGDGAVLSAVR
jgi:hypothetical protein